MIKDLIYSMQQKREKEKQMTVLVLTNYLVIPNTVRVNLVLFVMGHFWLSFKTWFEIWPVLRIHVFFIYLSKNTVETFLMWNIITA